MIRLAALALLVLALAPGTLTNAALAQPAPEDPAAERAWLFETLRTAPTERLGRVIEDQVWRYWMRQAPDETGAELMAEAMERREAHDFAGAMEALDELMERAPDWAEVWNQRATVLFHQERYDRSLAAIARTLELEPKHFGALAGKALILMRQGRARLARKALSRAVEIHPWLKERNMLPPEPPGTDL